MQCCTRTYLRDTTNKHPRVPLWTQRCGIRPMPEDRKTHQRGWCQPWRWNWTDGVLVVGGACTKTDASWFEFPNFGTAWCQGPATSPAKLRMKWRKSRVSRCFLKAELDATLVVIRVQYSLGTACRLLHRCHDVKMTMALWHHGLTLRTECLAYDQIVAALAQDLLWYAMLLISFSNL